jgi:ferredoxin
MTTPIFYFSGTGNSLAVARRIAEALGDGQPVPIVQALSTPSMLRRREKRIGIVTPDHFLGLPRIVAAFLSKLSCTGTPYLFMIATCGNPFGTLFAESRRILRPAGLSLSYGRYLTMPDTYLPMFNIAPEEAAKILSITDEHLGSMIADIGASRHGVVEKTMGLGALLGWYHRHWIASVAGKDRHFRVDETCTSCGTCVRVCPVDNIELVDGRPCWRHRCEQCFACIHFCPVAAIQFKKATRNKHRYHHPAIGVADVVRQKENGE